MNTRIVLVILIALTFLNIALLLYPAHDDLGPIVNDMEVAIEQEFKCTIDSTSYELLIWHQSLYFRCKTNSSAIPSSSEASRFLKSQFPDFTHIDELIIE